MGFGQVLVERQSLLRRILRLRESLVSRQYAVVDQHAVAIGQSRVSRRVVRIDIYRLFEEFGALLNVIGGSFAPGVAAFHIKLLGFEAALLLAAQFQPQFVGDIAGDLLLDQKQVGDFSVVLFAPQVTVVGRVNQRDGNLQV